MSFSLLLMQQVLLVCSLVILQPFGRPLVEAGQAFFEMERQKNALHRVLEFGAGKCFDWMARIL